MATENTNASPIPELYAPFLDNVKKLFDTPTYSDLTVTCGDRKWLVHRAIVCSRSKYFANVCNSGMKEAQENIIPLNDVKPNVVEAMLRYLYTYDYTDAVTNGQGDTAPIVFDVYMHIVGDRFGLTTLESLAASKFAKHANEDWKTSAFADAIEIVYNEDPDHKRALRDCIIATCSKHGDALRKEDFGERFREVVSSVPAFGGDLFVGCSSATKDEERFCCLGCSDVFAVKIEDVNGLYNCPSCGWVKTGNDWRLYKM